MRNWTTVDQQAESAGIAENRMRSYRTKIIGNKSIIYNNVVRYNSVPATVIKKRTVAPGKHEKINVDKPEILKLKMPVFNLLED